MLGSSVRVIGAFGCFSCAGFSGSGSLPPRSYSRAWAVPVGGACSPLVLSGVGVYAAEELAARSCSRAWAVPRSGELVARSCSRAWAVPGRGACSPPPPVAAPLACSLRAPFRGDPRMMGASREVGSCRDGGFHSRGLGRRAAATEASVAVCPETVSSTLLSA